MAADALDTIRALRPTILVVDDDAGLRESFHVILEDEYEVLDAPDGYRALDLLRSCQVDLVLLDVRLPGLDGIEVLKQIKALDDSLDVILVTAVKTARTAVLAMKLGAFDYVEKPFEEEEVLAIIRRALARRSLEREVVFLRSELARQHDFDEIVGASPPMAQVFQLVAQVARTTATVLITGESGTGKELVARAIHRQSARADKPFVPVSASAIPESLLESELFGHERGAFTGAYQRKLGKFELAQGGTLFLDEIANLREAVQAKLLRVLQEREIERVGGTTRIKLDVRIVAATNADLKQAVAGRTFRPDLYYRLNVVPITVPPLRDRREDIALLAEHFIRKFSPEYGKHVERLSPDALEALRAYPWPGNVRELENVIARAVVLAAGAVIQLGDLPVDVMLEGGAVRARESDVLPLREACEEFERHFVRRVLERAGWNRAEAARLLGIHPSGLKAKISRWKLTRDEPPGSTG